MGVICTTCLGSGCEDCNRSGRDLVIPDNLTAVCIVEGCERPADPEYELCPECWRTMPERRVYPF